MEASDGTFLDVFEWTSAEAIQIAHEHEEVRKMWAEFAEVCDYVPIGEVDGAASLFSEFTPVEFG